MNFNIRGISLKKDFQVKAAKLAIALILSNIFFFMLFSGGNEEKVLSPGLLPGQVELQLRASFLTPYESGKKILLIHRHSRSKAEGKMKSPQDAEGKVTVEVQEKDAELLLRHAEWEIAPFIKSLNFKVASKGESYEIRY